MGKVLYVQTDPKNRKGVASPLLSDREYDALFCDRMGARTHLKACLLSLKSGDTLYVSREADLADELDDAVAILEDLADRGVDVWVERISRLFEAKDSPFGSRIRVEAAEALMKFHRSFVSLRLEKGREASTKQAGRPRIVLPEGFEEAKNDWLTGKTTSTEAASRCGMALATFRKWAKLMA